MITGRDFIFTGLQAWDMSIGSNAKDIALEISQNNRVLYINAPRKDIKSYKIKKITESLWSLDIPVAMMPINFLPDGHVFDLVNKFNQKRICKYIKKAIRELGFANYIHFIDNDIYNSFFLKEILEASFTLYYRRDNMTSAYWYKHAPRLEPLLCAKCDCVISNSLELAQAVQSYNKNVYDVGQGVDLSKYSPEIDYIVPEDIATIAHPIIGYTGWVATLRLDIELVYRLAEARSDISFVFVGNEDEKFMEHKIHKLPNVYFLGKKDSSLMPNYISSFDICYNPQIINRITIGNYPRKIDEYLAFGKPTIATRTKTMAIFEDYVWNCDTFEDYLRAIDEALKPNDDKDVIGERIKFANSHSWANSVRQIYECISK